MKERIMKRIYCIMVATVFRKFRRSTAAMSSSICCNIRAARQENWSSRFPTRYDINRSVQSQKRARSFKFQIEEEEELFYPSSENKSADQLCSYCTADCTADLTLCFRIGKNPVFS